MSSLESSIALLKSFSAHTYLKEVLNVMCEKFVIDGQSFDAWYTNRDYVLRELEERGRSIASQIRQFF